VHRGEQTHLIAQNDMATIRRLTLEPPDALLAEITDIRRTGGVIAVPTESSYGLAADPWNAGAVQRICTLKGGRDRKPILVLIADLEQLGPLVRDTPPAARLLMNRFWPGPLTLVLPAASGLPAALTAGTETIGIRLTAYPLLQRIIRHAGPLTGTSANRAEEEAALTADAVQTLFAAQVELILDGGRAPGAAPSTVVHAVGAPFIIREGAIPAKQITDALKR
jgi:L-threonylcarbamoyladenylate synthase